MRPSNRTYPVLADRFVGQEDGGLNCTNTGCGWVVSYSIQPPSAGSSTWAKKPSLDDRTDTSVVWDASFISWRP